VKLGGVLDLLNSPGQFTPVLWLWLSGTIFESQQVMGPEPGL